jgi:TRAP-type C4-dicarboxylate transport system substrate-binding protein
MKTIRYAALAIAALAVAASTSADVRAVELKLAHFVAPTHPYHPVFQWLAGEVSKETNGALTIRIFPGGELGANPAEQFNRAVDGIADIAFVIPGYTAAQFPRTLVIEYPGVRNDAVAGTDALWNARDALRDEYRRVKLLSLWTINPAVLFTRDKPIRKLEDLKGLKMRVASKSGGDMIKAWGGTPVFSPVTEMYNSIQTGVVDGTIIDAGAAIAFKLTEICNHVTVGMNSTMTSFSLVMNRASWDKLPAEQKAALDKFTGIAIARKNNEAWDSLVDRGLKLMGSTPGKQVITLDPAEAAKFNAAAQSVLTAYVAELDSKRLDGTTVLKELMASKTRQ